MLYFLIGQTISAAMIIFPLALLQFRLNLRGTYEGLSLVYAAGGLPFTIFVLYSFFAKVPVELYDAARIDGCGEFKCFFFIAVPMVKTGFATIGLFQFMWVWNEFTIALTLTSNAEMRTLPVGLYTVVQGVLATNYVMAFAGTMIVSIPIIIIYLVFQKYLIRGLAEGAIKI
jgi:multiple sugar transport system permease protein/raffinose/stachyose/melibiose transport system permease protein/N-acetylglucosamine transport system permease protein